VARPLRICIPGGLYHVISRGNARQRVYGDDTDRELFLELLVHTHERYCWFCHAYCLMDNHYHLLVETPKPNLPLAMRQLNGLYARRFNRRHGRCGHVFQARYRAILVEKESHLHAACRYIVRNPVRARICEHPGEHHWSSFQATAGLEPAPSFLATEAVLAMFGSDRRRAQIAYQQFATDSADDELLAHVQGERLGRETFLRESFGLEPPLSEVARAEVEPLPPELHEIFARESSLPVLAAYRRHGYAIAQIAAHLGCHYSTVSRRLRREEAAERSMRECKT